MTTLTSNGGWTEDSETQSVDRQRVDDGHEFAESAL